MTSADHEEHTKKYDYFVDGKKYESTSSTITGATIRAAVGMDPTLALWEEGHGDEPDRQIADNTSIDLTKSKGGPPRFYTVPPATFGASDDADR